MAWQEGILYILAVFIPALVLSVLAPWFSIPFWILTLGAVNFFRDPAREPDHTGERSIVSAADGKVVVVDEVESPEFGLGKMKRVAVFLSVFDVHVNRSPAPGIIAETAYRPGAFLDARTHEIDLKNERMLWKIDAPQGTFIISQIAGLIARRIVPWKTSGQKIGRGDRIGMIRFGSRTDVYLPPACEITVKPGEHVYGGKTVIARWPQTP